MELYGLVVFENELAQAVTAIHPSLFLKSTTTPGLSDRLGLLQQNYVLLENYMEDDPDEGYFEELS